MAETPPAPTEATLHEAAVRHLARYAATRLGLVRVLDRRVDRWSRAQAEPDSEAVARAKAAVRAVVARLADTGLVDDAAFAESRARGMVRAGRSRRGIAAHLAARGIGAEDARAALPDDVDSELAAALVLARRRRIGPFRAADAPEPVDRRRELGMLARAGFAQEVASRALAMPMEEAEARVHRLRQP